MLMRDKINVATLYMKKVRLEEGREWFSPTEIGGEINGGHSSVGSPVCKKMVELGIAARNDKGHYRLKRKNPAKE